MNTRDRDIAGAMGGDSATVQGPRTLIISWHWPPTNRASAGVLGALFGSAPPGVFRVVTRSFPDYAIEDHREACGDLACRVPATYVPWRGDDQSQPAPVAFPALLITVMSMIRSACRLGDTWKAERVLAVFPHRWSLLAGALIAWRLKLPLALYMHDLCAEALAFRNPVRRWFWQFIDRVCLRRASLVLVPTEEFAAHYRRRGLRRCVVLAHCVSRRARASAPPPGDGRLRLLYSGALYEPHASAAEAFIAATRSCNDVRVTYLTDPNACGGLLGRVGARWLPHAEAIAELPRADVFVVLLGIDAPCSEEVQGCFPSKLIDYLSIGRPILAIVPAGCFVDRIVSSNGCGIVVPRHDTTSIRAAIDGLRDPGRRSEMACAARALAQQFRSEDWMERLMGSLASGAAVRSSWFQVPHRHPRVAGDRPVPRKAESDARLRQMQTKSPTAESESGIGMVQDVYSG